MGEQLCEYGCGGAATYQFKNGKWCCREKYRSCPYQAATIGAKRKGTRHTQHTKTKIGQQTKQRLAISGPPFKGKRHTEETKQRISQINKGRTSWAKGLSKDTHPGIYAAWQFKLNNPAVYAHSGSNNGMFGRTHSAEVKQRLRDINKSSGKWSGPDNPWYGKDRSSVNSPRFLDELTRSEWKKYSSRARMLSERTYKNKKEEINPNNLPRGTKLYHLDHIIPLWYGFLNNINPERLSVRENLRIVWWSDNMKRYKTKLLEEEIILLGQL